MPPPTVFLSHSAQDESLILRLADHLEGVCQASIRFFVAGRDLPPGVAWEQRIIEELDACDLVLAVFSPSALESNWVLFETGYARGRGKLVIPVGLPGQSVAAIPPPVGSLQGFDLHSESGLAKLISALNDKFGHRHPALISKTVFERVITGRAVDSTAPGLPPSGSYRVYSRTSGQERPHELLELRIEGESMRAETDRWTSTGFFAESRYSGRFKYSRGSSPSDMGTHEMTWTGAEFVGRAVSDSQKWKNETLVWRPGRAS